jgi:hypothetical protein
MVNLAFETRNQEFFIALDSPGAYHTPVNAGSLSPNTHYLVSVQVKNPTSNSITGTFTLTGGVFVIGNPPSATATTVTKVIPGATGMDPWGTAWVTFKYLTGPSGHGCLFASIVKENNVAVSPVPVIQQNTDTIGQAIGATSTYSFQVYLPPSYPEVWLRLTEVITSGSSGTWQPKMVGIPPVYIDLSGVHGHVGPGGAGNMYTVQLQVKIPSTATNGESHDFTILGDFVDQAITDPTEPNFAGVVTVTIQASNQPALPSKLWMDDDGHIGGPNDYDSASIRLYDGSKLVSDYEHLKPSYPYHFHVRIGNNGAEAKGVTVKFLAAGSLSPSPTTLATIQADIPNHGKDLTSPVDFVSAPGILTLNHRCAVVEVDAVDNVDNTGHSVPTLYAWRNTDSLILHILSPIKIPLELAWPPWLWIGPDPGPERAIQVGIKVEVQQAAAGWEKDKTILAELKKLKEENTVELGVFQTAAFKALLKKAALPLEVKVLPITGVKPGQVIFRKDEKKAAWTVSIPAKVEMVPFAVEGVVPKDAKAGQIFVVVVSAAYPKVGRFPAETVQFRTLITVTDK